MIYVVRRITKSQYDEYYITYRNRIAEIDADTKLLQDAEGNYYLSVDSLLNLSNRAKELFESSEIEEKRQLIKLVIQNLKLEGSLVRYDYLKPFSTIVEYADRSDWLRD